MKIAAASLVALFVTTAAPAQQPIDYRIDKVKRTVILQSGENEARIASGQLAHGGDLVKTGWFSYALIGAEKHAAKFEIFSSTDVKLADGTPGVILSVERGRIRAAFDKITGSEPRVVKTPGALLAVRGTQFDVEVDTTGNTTVDVFEGIVEVQSPLRTEPLFVRAGEQSRHGPREAPQARPMPEDRRRGGPEGTRGPDGGERPRGEPRVRPEDPREPRPGPPRPGDTPHPGGHQPRPPKP